MSRGYSYAQRWALQTAAVSGNGGAAALNAECVEHSFYIKGIGAVSAGAIQLETADDKDYAGTWAPLGSPVTVPAAAETVVQITGAFGAVRARISTGLVGGTVSVILFAN